MNTNFDPRSPSTSYAGSSPGTPLNSIQYSNIPSVGSSGTLNSPMRHSNANPVHRIQKSAGVKQLYTSDWINGGFAQQTNPDMQVPSRPGSTAPSVCSDMSVMSHMSTMSGMSQFSTLSVNTNLTGFTQVYAMQPHRVGIENKKPNLRTPQHIDCMNDFIKKIVFLLETNDGDKAIERLKSLCRQPESSEYFELPKQEMLNNLFSLIFAEIEKICRAINPNIEKPEIDGRLSTWIFFLCNIYCKKIKPAILATENVLLVNKRYLIPDFCNLLLSNRKFSLQMVTFLCSLFLESGNYKSVIRRSRQQFKVIDKLLDMADTDFTNASTRAKALHMVRIYLYGRSDMENQMIDHKLIEFVLNRLLTKEVEEPVIFHILKLVAQLLVEKRKSATVDRSKARQQFYEANGVEIVSNLMKTHGSSRVIHECLIVVENFCKHEISRENLLILLPALFQLYGSNDMEMTAYLSSIICHIVKNHKEQVFEMGGVGKVFHMLSHVKEFDPNDIYQLRLMQNPQTRLKNRNVEVESIKKRIEDIADNCFLALKLMGNMSANPQIEPQFMEQLFCWRRLGNEGNPHTFDAGDLLLDYLGAKIMLRQRVLKLLNCLWSQPHVDYKFKKLMLDVRGGQYKMELSQLLIAIIHKSYEDYNNITDAAYKKYTNNVIIECCLLLEAMCSIGTRTEDRLHVQQVILHLTMDCRNNSQLREPLTLLEQCDKERDLELLTFIGQLVTNYPETVSIFNSPRQLKVVEDLSVNSDAKIQDLACSIRDEILREITKSQMMSYSQGFHSLTPKMTPNYGYDPNRTDTYSDDSDTSPNLNRHYNYH